VIHDGVEAAEVSEHEVEPAVREDTLHQADEVGGEVDAAVAQVPFDGTEGVWRAIVVDGQVVSNLSNTKPIRKNYGKLLKRLGELRIITIFAS
jgi:hypothetical protein